MPMPEPVSLLCLPCAGASATMYFRWRRLLPSWIRVLPVELPGRGSRMSEPFVEDFDALVARLCDEQTGAMRGRFALFGHSMGALLAYGMAQRLRASGAAMPLALLLSASPAPSHRNPDCFEGKDTDEGLIKDLRKQGGTPEEVFANPELLRLTLDVLGADYRVCQSFQHVATRPVSSPIHVFAGRADDIEADCIEAWALHASAGLTLDWFDGGHFFIREQESGVLAALERRLAQGVASSAHREKPVRVAQ